MLGIIACNRSLCEMVVFTRHSRNSHRIGCGSDRIFRGLTLNGRTCNGISVKNITSLCRIAVYLTEDSAVYSSSFLCKYREYRETYFREELCAPCVFPIENGALRMPVERAKFDDMEKLVEYSEPLWVTSSIVDFCYIVEILDRYSEKTGDNFTFADGMAAEQFDTYMKKAMEVEFSFYKDDLGLNVY